MTQRDFQKRLAKLRRIFSEEQPLDAALITSVPTIAYLTGYFGFSPIEREAYLLVTKSRVFLFTDGRYSDAVREIPHLTLLETAAETPFLKNLEDVQSKQHILKLGIEKDSMTVAEYMSIRKIFPKLSTLDTRSLRETKAPQEIMMIAKASRIADYALAKVLPQVEAGMTEKSVSRMLEINVLEKGAHLSFPTIVAFGKNSAVPHHMTGETKLKKRDTILIDFGVKYRGYCSDMTRTFFVGEQTKKQKDVFAIVHASQHAAIYYIKKQLAEKKPVLANETDKRVRDYIIQEGYPTIPHSLGHGIGLEVHEAPTLTPRSKDTLTEDTVFSIEPGIYLPGEFGVRIEDLFTIQYGRLKKLTLSPLALIS